MSNEEKQLLFGEYASGNIAPADKRRLMAAALEDQHLFNSIAEQEELSELTVTLPSDDPYELPRPIAAAQASRAGAAPAPLPQPRRNPWPFLFTGAAALALAVTGVFLLRTQTEPKTKIAQVPPVNGPAEPQSANSSPKELAAPPQPMRAAKPAPTVLRQERREDKSMSAPPAQPVAQDLPESAPAAKSAVPVPPPSRSREEAQPVTVGSINAPRFQLLRRGPTGALAPASELQDGDALVVRYVPTQPGPIDLQDLATNTTLVTRNATPGQSLDFPLTAVRGTMNLELRPRPPGDLASFEFRAAAPAAASGGAANRDEAVKDRKAASRSAAPSPPSVRIVLTVR